MIQLILMVVVGGGFAYFALTQTKKMKDAAPGTFEGERARLSAVFAALRQPGESEAAFVGAGTHKLTGNKQFYLALTDQRLLLDESNSGKPMRVYPRSAVSIQAKPKKWTDVGNMQVRVSHGYEVVLGLPSAESHTLRLHTSSEYDPALAPAVGEFLRQVHA